MMLQGVPVVISPHVVRRVEDWTRCRAPSRARRRLAQGHRQHLVVREVPAAFMILGRLHTHPDMWAAIQMRLGADSPTY